MQGEAVGKKGRVTLFIGTGKFLNQEERRRWTAVLRTYPEGADPGGAVRRRIKLRGKVPRKGSCIKENLHCEGDKFSGLALAGSRASTGSGNRRNCHAKRDWRDRAQKTASGMVCQTVGDVGASAQAPCQKTKPMNALYPEERQLDRKDRPISFEKDRGNAPKGSY